jgi:glycosyltransferase involved in cell wall biosynthesis
LTVPVLSVTVTNYNYAPFLPQNIESILRQTFGDFELILIDNASTDESVDVMRRYAADDGRIKVVTHAENVGMFGSYREAGELAQGRYRVPVDADDWVLEPDAFASQVNMLDAHPAATFVYSAMTMVESNGLPIHVSHPYPHDIVLPGELALEKILTFNLTHSGLMHRLDAYHRTGGYRPTLPHVADMLLGVQLSELGDVGYVDRSLYAFRQHGTNVHLSPQLEVVKNEILTVIDEAFAGPLASRLPDAAAARQQIVRRALVHLPTQYIFSGELWAGWRLYWESAKVRPIDTVFQRRTLNLLARTLLGGKGYARLVSLVRGRIGSD